MHDLLLCGSITARQILKRIWDIADWQKRGLAWEEFVVTLKLISAAQKKC